MQNNKKLIEYNQSIKIVFFFFLNAKKVFLASSKYIDVPVYKNRKVKYIIMDILNFYNE